MGDIFRRIGRAFLAIITLGLVKLEDPRVMAPYIIDNMRRKLEQVQKSAVPIIANQYRIERMLSQEQQKLAQLDADARQAVLQREDDLAGSLLLQKEAAQERVNNLLQQLELSRQQAEEAQAQIQNFEEELQVAEERTRNAQMRYQLASMRSQLSKIGARPSLDSDIKAIERIEERADELEAESQALNQLSNTGNEAKLRQIRKTARESRADAALQALKAEMGLSDTEKRFQRVSVEIGQDQQGSSPQDQPPANNG
ncbi:MAG: PspA/IM30 family protein [Armatimonadetes bacterium]|nr:PspA/IM30 family protein [Armatimonadota bacterium]